MEGVVWARHCSGVILHCLSKISTSCELLLGHIISLADNFLGLESLGVLIAAGSHFGNTCGGHAVFGSPQLSWVTVDIRFYE